MLQRQTRLPIPAIPIISLRVVREAEIACDRPQYPVRRAEDAYQLLKDELCARDREVFAALHLNARLIAQRLEIVSVGSLDASICHPREVFKSAVLESAANLVLVHNHPSGDPAPSAEDYEVAKRMVQAGKILGIQVVDSLIIAERGYMSMWKALRDVFASWASGGVVDGMVS